MKATGEQRAAGMDSDDRQGIGGRVLLGDLMGDPPQGSPQVVVLEHELLTHRTFASFLASQGLVKGRGQRSKGWRRLGAVRGCLNPAKSGVDEVHPSGAGDTLRC